MQYLILAGRNIIVASPNSPFICMQLLFSFHKEEDNFIQEEEKKLRHQIRNLEDITFTLPVYQQKFHIQVQCFQSFLVNCREKFPILCA
jgi:hypothetical protein